MFGNKILKSTLVFGLLTLAGLTFSFQANAACSFVSTKDGSSIAVKGTPEDSAIAKTFLETCDNGYTKAFAKDPDAAKAGKKVLSLNGCTGCHGGNLGGLMAPSLTKGGGQGAYDTKWVYAKHATDKGIFETVSGGSPGTSGGVMQAWHKTVDGHVGEGLSTDELLKAIAYIRTQYKGDGEKTWLK